MCKLKRRAAITTIHTKQFILLLFLFELVTRNKWANIILFICRISNSKFYNKKTEHRRNIHIFRSKTIWIAINIQIRSQLPLNAYTMNVVSFEFEKKIKFLYSMNYELANLIENSVILQKEKTTEKNRTQLYFHLWISVHECRWMSAFLYIM